MKNIYIICPFRKELTDGEVKRIQDHVSQIHEDIEIAGEVGSIFCKLKDDFLTYEEVCDIMVGADEIHIWKSENNTVFFELGILQTLRYSGLNNIVKVINKKKKSSKRISDIMASIMKSYEAPKKPDTKQ